MEEVRETLPEEANLTKTGSKRKGQQIKKQPPKKKSKAEEIKVQYHIEDNLCFVVPYSYSFASSAKQRWWGANLLSIYSKEFAAYPEEYYVIFFLPKLTLSKINPFLQFLTF